ncbi:MAG: PDZ domain-containing protein, partial [Nitrospinota bacterium]|nr:PDZ domain-containing protein [Nitrospinota bacterium]
GARAGLRKGDVIIEVNRKPVKTVEEYRKALFPGRSPQMLLIQRGSRTTFVTVESE